MSSCKIVRDQSEFSHRHKTGSINRTRKVKASNLQKYVNQPLLKHCHVRLRQLLVCKLIVKNYFRDFRYHSAAKMPRLGEICANFHNWSRFPANWKSVRRGKAGKPQNWCICCFGRCRLSSIFSPKRES